jgi:hypothetical protein
MPVIQNIFCIHKGSKFTWLCSSRSLSGYDHLFWGNSQLHLGYEKVTVGNGESLSIEGVGNIRIPVFRNDFVEFVTLHDVYLIPNL